MPDVFVTGVGIISPLGTNSKENLNGLRCGKTAIRRAAFFKSRFVETHAFGEVNASTKSLLDMLKTADKAKLTRTDALAFIAFDEAVKDAQLTQEDISDYETAFISGSTVGGMCAHKALLHDVLMPTYPSAFLSAYPNAAHTLNITAHYGIRGLTNTINTACSSAANAIIMGARLILSGKAKRVVVGGADSLSKYTVNGFNALRILSDSPCRPFDKDRKGLSLAEGAAYIVMENSELAAGKRKYAKVSGFANTSDAFHHSSLSDDAAGITKVLKEALMSAKLKPEAIDYINTHGTGTENNDKVELLGLSKIFNPIPPYNATKSYTGHTLGAAGCVEAIFSIFSLVYGELYPSLQCDNPDTGIHNNPIIKYEDGLNFKHVLSNSFGFGSNCTCIIFSKI